MMHEMKQTTPMLEILDTLVSLDLFKVFFCCDLEKCHGACCIEGDAGAPVMLEEVGLLEEAYEVVHDELSQEARQQVENEGVVYPDREGELVNQIVRGKDCVFVKNEGPCAFCAIDSAYRCGRFHWQKPISCALYPVRLSTVGGVTAVNVHKWTVVNQPVTWANDSACPSISSSRSPSSDGSDKHGGMSAI